MSKNNRTEAVAKQNSWQPSPDQRLWMYKTMVKARYFEDSIKPIYVEGKQPRFNMANGPIPGEMHLASGQEPCAVGVCVHLRPEDTVTATHRPHHVAIAKGVNIDAMAAEILGKETGLSNGRGGHMHLFDARVNFACSGIIAQGMGPAAGAALAAQRRGSDAVAVSYIGEGAANQGAFHEVLNLAALWKLPAVFIIEDNGWGVSVAKRAATAIERNADRAAGYGIPGIYVSNNDPDEIFSAAGEAVQRARSGAGPTLIEIETVRLEGHFMGDAEGYRPKSEMESLPGKDPIPHYKKRLIAMGLNAAEIEKAEVLARQEVDSAFKSARAAPYPQPEDAFEKVFV